MEPLSPSAVEVLLRIHYFGDPLVAPFPQEMLLQSLRELSAAGLVEPYGETYALTTAGRDWADSPLKFNE